MTDVGLLRQQIALLIERKRYGDAGRLLSEAISSEPEDPGFKLLAARLGIATADYRSARDNLEAALAQHPDNAEARQLMFELLCETGQFVEAEQTIIGLLHDYPEEAYFYALYAALMLKTLHIDKAAALAREGLRLDPTSSLSQVISLMVDVIEDRSHDASRRLEELVRENPDALHVAWSVVLVLQSRHRYAEALQVLRGIFRSVPDDKEAVAALIEMRVLSHWSMLPLTPLQRYGWVGSGVLWAVAVLSVFLADRFAPQITSSLVVFYLGYVVYSWLWPPMLKRWLSARGF
ncbi:MAG: tetratricopeptide repeat protein [Rhodospirillales bacterium]|nr:MAG: tetratricopeptide repeat protein [Rhodospirillales bacterium]